MCNKRQQRPRFFYRKGKTPFGLDPAKLDHCRSDGKHFETKDEIERWTKNHAEVLGNLRNGAARQLRDRLLACVHDDETCGLTVCPACMARYRRWFTAQLSAIYLALDRKMKYVTIILAMVEPGQLASLRLDRLHRTLRMQFDRAGHSAGIAIGGTEIGWKQGQRLWAVHVHLCVSGWTPDVEQEVERLLGNPRSVKAMSIQDPLEVLTYCQKFGLTHHPGSRTGEERGRCFPLPVPQGVELASYMISHRPEDFLFCRQASRSGQRIRLYDPVLDARVRAVLENPFATLFEMTT